MVKHVQICSFANFELFGTEAIFSIFKNTCCACVLTKDKKFLTKFYMIVVLNNDKFHQHAKNGHRTFLNKTTVTKKTIIFELLLDTCHNAPEMFVTKNRQKLPGVSKKCIQS